MKNVTKIVSISTLTELELEWNDVYQHSLLQSQFSSHQYVVMWYENFAKPESVLVYRLKENNITIGFMPLVLNVKFGMRKLNNLYNEHCLNPQPLIRKGFELTFQKFLLDELFADRKNWDVFQYEYSYSFSPFSELFTDDQLIKCKLIWNKTKQPTYTIILNKTYEAYKRFDLNSKNRASVNKYRNKIANIEHEFLHYQGAEAIKHWQDFIEIEDSGWKGIKGSSIKKTSTCIQIYYDKLLNILVASQTLHLHFLKVKDEIIAASFGFTENNVFHAFKLGYDEAFSQYAPGVMLNQFVVELLLRDYPKITIFHQYPWSYGYKHRYANASEMCLGTVIYSKTIRGRMFHVMRRIKIKMRDRHPDLMNLVKKIKNIF